MQTEPLYTNQLGKPASMDLHGMLLQSPVRRWLDIGQVGSTRSVLVSTILAQVAGRMVTL